MLEKLLRILGIALVVLAVCMCGAPAIAQDTCTFTATSGVWDSGGNWSCGHAPGGGDDAVIPSGKTCRIENMSNFAFAKTIDVDGTLEIRGETLILGATTEIDTTSNVDGNVYFEKVGSDNAVIVCRGAWVTINGTGALNASKAVNSNYEGRLECCSTGCGHNGDGFIFGSSLTVKGSMGIRACVEVNGTAKVDYSGDTMQVGDGAGIACADNTCDGPEITGTGKFKVTSGTLRFGAVGYENADAPKWEISGGEIEVFADGNFGSIEANNHIKITADGGTIDFGDNFLSNGGVEITNATMIKAAGKTVRFR
ncbi:MAG: hypothetical protein IT449_18160 [Phycisphaerales bacterium]|nr:hypothetical protein [Phycisphaerales bacterium]